MLTAPQLNALCRRMEAVRAAILSHQATEQQVWTLLQEASSLLNEALGSRYEQTLRVILDLLNSMWRVTRQQADLRRAVQAAGCAQGA